jgi:hypothetical protein
VRSPRRPVEGLGTGVPRLGAQSTSTSTAGSAQNARAGGQAPLNAAPISGTDKAVADAAPAQIASVYRPVISAVWRAKLRLTRPGSSTLPMAIPAPASTDDANSGASVPAARSTVPTVMSSRASSSTRSGPYRRASAGVGAENSPRHTIGKVVSMLAPTADRPVSRMISGNTTDRLPNTGRRLQAMRIRLRPSSHLCW